MARWSSAASAGLLLAALAPAAPAVELGRLFLTPAERNALERARHEAAVNVPTLPAEESPGARLAAPLVGAASAPFTLDGYVRRSEGPPTVWINGIDSYQGNLLDLGITARDLVLEAAGVRVPLADATSTPPLKPGQSFDPQRARVVEAWEPPAPPLLVSPAGVGREE